MKFIDFLKTHYISIIGGIIVLAILAYGIGTAYQTAKFNQTIDNRSIEANNAVKEAANAKESAVNASIERRTEDALRDKIITPKLDESRRRSANSKAALDEARKNYNDKKNDTSNLVDSRADNCAELQRLFPDIQFEDCF